jgi:hypothetical protein
VHLSDWSLRARDPPLRLGYAVLATPEPPVQELSYFGVESTYGCALAIARRILSRELAS